MKSRKFTVAVAASVLLVGCSSSPESNDAQADESGSDSGSATRSIEVKNYLRGVWNCPESETRTNIGFEPQQRDGEEGTPFLIAGNNPASLQFTEDSLYVINGDREFLFWYRVDENKITFTGTGENSQFKDLEGETVSISLPDELSGEVTLEGSSSLQNGSVAMSFTPDAFTIFDGSKPADQLLALTCTKATN